MICSRKQNGCRLLELVALVNRGIQLIASISVLALIVLGVVLGSRFGTDPLDVESPLIGQPLPPLILETISGEPFAFTDLSGSPTVVNVWASWCLPCRAEHAVLQSGAEAYQGVDFVGVVYQDSASRAQSFLDTYGGGYPNVMDPDARAAIDLGVFGVPETFFVDAAGTIVAKVQGPITASILEETLNAVLLGEQPGTRTAGTVQLAE